MLDDVDWDQRFKLPRPSWIWSPGLVEGEPVINSETSSGLVGVTAPNLEASSVLSEPFFLNLFQELARDKRGAAVSAVNGYSGDMGLDERPCPSEVKLWAMLTRTRQSMPC